MVVSMKQMTNQSKWYQSWFETPYYHILYKHRDDREAQVFIKNLISRFKIKTNQKVLDLACGKGRHSIYLNSLGFEVLGVDLSAQNIHIANTFANPTLKFEEHDMRLPLKTKFDAVFNLFTSFGYFDAPSDDLKVINSIKQSLSNNGLGLIDFMNVQYVIEHLVPEESINCEGLIFNINRRFDGQSIVKNIEVIDNDQVYNYMEQVRAYRLKDFQNMLNTNGLQLLTTFGDYNLNPFDEINSKRLILAFTNP